MSSLATLTFRRRATSFASYLCAADSGDFSEVDLPSLPAGLTWSNGVMGGNVYALAIVSTGSVPELPTWIMMAFGLVVLGAGRKFAGKGLDATNLTR